MASTGDARGAERDRPAIGFAGIVDEHHARIYRFLLKLVGNPVDAEDLAQQTFLEAYRSFASFRGEAAVSTWLHGIALNVARSHRRSPAVRHCADGAEALLDVAADGADPETGAADRERCRRALAVLDALPVDVRMAFALVVLDGQSYEAAAAALAVPVATVRGRVFRAREKIREAVDVTTAPVPPTHRR